MGDDNGYCNTDRETTELIKTLNILENYNYKVCDILIFQ